MARDAATCCWMTRHSLGVMTDGSSLPLPLVLPTWKANTSMSLLVDKREKR